MFHGHFTSLIALVRIRALVLTLLADLEGFEGILFQKTYLFAVIG